VKCVICGIRKPKRHCLGVHGDICTICCGTEREQTVLCPLDCEYLHEAHMHERVPEVDLAKIPNIEVKLTEKFLQENEGPLFVLGAAVFEATVKSHSATDYDAREALEALITSYKAMETGLIYESKPVNPYAAAIYDLMQKRVQEVRDLKEQGDPTAIELRDAVILGVLIFLQRLEYRNNNGRKRSRAFLEILQKFYGDHLETFANSPEPEEPLIIL
jgi:hypothetical protein